MEQVIAFCVQEHERPGVEVRVNFGVFAGRNATQAEIDDLARVLRDEVTPFSVVAVERHEFGGEVETSVRQIVIEAPAKADEERLVEIAERWARECILDRTQLGDLGSEL